MPRESPQQRSKRPGQLKKGSRTTGSVLARNLANLCSGSLTRHAEYTPHDSTGLPLLCLNCDCHRPDWQEALARLGRRLHQQRRRLRHRYPHRPIRLRPRQPPLHRPLHQQPRPLAPQKAKRIVPNTHAFRPLPRCTVSSTSLFSSPCKIFRTKDRNSLTTSTIILVDYLVPSSYHG